MREHNHNHNQVLNFQTLELMKELPDHISHFSQGNFTGLISIDEIIDPSGHFFSFLITQHQMKIDTEFIIPIKKSIAIVFVFSTSNEK